MTEEQLITKSEGKYGKGKTVVLVLKPNVLANSVYYRFKLTAINSDATTAAAVIDFKTNGAPSAGICNF